MREYRCLVGREAAEFRAMADEAIASALLAPEITVVDETEMVFSARDEAWFAQGAVVERTLHRQGLNSGTGEEISSDELAALSAAECSRGERP